MGPFKFFLTLSFLCCVKKHSKCLDILSCCMRSIKCLRNIYIRARIAHTLYFVWHSRGYASDQSDSQTFFLRRTYLKKPTFIISVCNLNHWVSQNVPFVSHWVRCLASWQPESTGWFVFTIHPSKSYLFKGTFSQTCFDFFCKLYDKVCRELFRTTVDAIGIQMSLICYFSL